MINTILISLSCLLICSCLAFIFFSNRNRTGLLLSRLPYKKIDKIFTPAELNFYKSLNKVVSARFKIFGKVRIADVIELEGNLPERSRSNCLIKLRISISTTSFVMTRSEYVWP